MAGKKRLLTGLQASGQLHIGNYLGALKPFVEAYGEYESFLMVADYHALTSLRDPKELGANIISVVKDYLAVGVDPRKAVIFKQSDVPEHTELSWILSNFVSMGALNRMTQYKEKTEDPNNTDMTSSSPIQDVNFLTEDSVLIHATLYNGSGKGVLILVMHPCNLRNIKLLVSLIRSSTRSRSETNDTML